MSEFTADGPSTEQLSPLEQRVHRLESAVAALQGNPPAPERAAEPLAPPSPPPTSNAIHDGIQAATAPIMAAVADAAVRAAIPVGPRQSRLEGIHWLVIDIIREAAAIFWMFIDLHYKVAWSTRLLTIILLPAILLSHWWLPFANVPVIGPFADKVLDLVLAFIMFKALSREAHRYLESRGSK
jgi:hypothetical protein